MGHDISAHRISKSIADYRRDAYTDSDIYEFLNVPELNVDDMNGEGLEVFDEFTLKEAIVKAKAAGEKHTDTVKFLETCLENINDDGEILITFD